MYQMFRDCLRYEADEYKRYSAGISALIFILTELQAGAVLASRNFILKKMKMEQKHTANILCLDEIFIRSACCVCVFETLSITDINSSNENQVQKLIM